MKRQSSVMATPQRGAVLPMVIVSLVVLIGMSGLALDLGHAYVNKTRLQNAVDAAALSGAKTLDITSDTVQATTAARNTFDLMVGENGNQELDAELSGSDLTIEFSNTLFTAGTTPARYIRARNNSFTRPTWLVRVFNLLPGVDFSTITVGASAVAGPSPVLAQICNVAPVVACGDPALIPSPTCQDCLYGYAVGDTVTLKTGHGNDWEVGPGNYQLIQLDCGPGGDCVRENMAGSYDQCWTVTDTVTTKPGNTVGPTQQGLCTRFGNVPGCNCVAGLDCANTYKPDWVSDAAGSGFPDTFAQYQTDYQNQAWDNPPPTGEPERRIVVVPIGDCTGTVNGEGEVPVLGLGCFFLTQPPKQGGDQEIYGEFIGDCNAKGVPGPDPGTGPGPHIIQLYKDPSSPDA